GRDQRLHQTRVLTFGGHIGAAGRDQRKADQLNGFEGLEVGYACGSLHFGATLSLRLAEICSGSLRSSRSTRSGARARFPTSSWLRSIAPPPTYSSRSARSSRRSSFYRGRIGPRKGMGPSRCWRSPSALPSRSSAIG